MNHHCTCIYLRLLILLLISEGADATGQNEDDEGHFDRISQVREAIRQKRCAEKGVPYIAPDEVCISKYQSSRF